MFAGLISTISNVMLRKVWVSLSLFLPLKWMHFLKKGKILINHSDKKTNK